jgi:hypothetical protein
MKKIILIFLFAISFQNVFGQAIRAKDIVFQPYIALNYGTNLQLPKEIGDINVKDSKINAIGILSEYFISNAISFGLDMNMKSTLEYDPITMKDISVSKNYTSQISMYRVYARMNFHLNTKNARFNLYSGYGIGLKYRVDKKYIEGVRQNFYEAGATSGTNQYSLRFCVGGRYFITQNIAIGGELAFGGPFALVGLTIKL